MDHSTGGAAAAAVKMDGALEALNLTAPERSWRDWIGPIASLFVVAACLLALRELHWRAVVQAVPHNPTFYLLFALYFVTQPGFDWLIYRRLWRLPPSGLLPLLRKYVGNEVLLGYIGEAYFYGWARQRLRFVTAPFGAIKDVTILSGLAGNIATLAVLAIAWPFFHELRLTVGEQFAIASIALITLASVGVLLFGQRLFSLARPELRDTFCLHLARIATALILTAGMWHVALPGAPLNWWVLLAAIRMLVSRLPFVPNKDMVFAGLAVVLVGPQAAITELIAAIAALTLTAQVVVGLPLIVSELIASRRA